MSQLDDFNFYLIDQVIMPYLWGGQHTKLTRSNYKEVIARREEKEENRRLVEQYCEKLFDDGYEVLYAYDCSGLGCYWIYNLKHLWKCDVTADTMMKRCELREDLPKKGWWVFKYNGKKATHIGYMIDDQYLVEAKGRKYGVVSTKFKKSDWDCWGIPKVFKDDISDFDNDQMDLPVDEDGHIIEPIRDPQTMVEVVGDSVYVRAGDNTDSKVLFTAHSKNGYKKNGMNHDSDRFELIDIAPTGWYHIATYKGDAYITNKEKYTKLINE